MRKIIVRSLFVTLLLLVVVLGSGGFWLWRQLHKSLPQVSGQVTLEGLRDKVTIERDGLGVPTIRAKNRVDLAFATGFLHGQERFFQMDLLRRNSAGELAELVGPALVEQDKRTRIHRFRDVARRVIATGDNDQKSLGAAYADGVNAGLAALEAKPFEYLAIRATPRRWTPEDTVLVLFSMYLDLQGEDHLDESAHGLMHDLLPEPVFAFLAPRGTEWDAPLEGPDFEVPPVPGPEVLDLRRQAAASLSFSTRSRRRIAEDREPPGHPGSNNWAVAGSHTQHGGAIVADDMHLGIAVPNIWYRARFVWPAAEGGEHEVTGVTLPGTFAMVVGSNQHVAWAFTNSEGDWVDLVVLEPDPSDAHAYLTPQGPRALERYAEVIHVRGQPDQTVEVLQTIWGPVVDTDHRGRQRALKWVAHEPEGVNFRLFELEGARTLEEAIQIANQSGAPAQNFTVADKTGRIGWTIMGRMPRRIGFDGRLPASWADGNRRWDGWLEPAEYPRVIDPPQGRIWTANARVVGGAAYELLGDGGYDLGARASQIRDSLLALEKASEDDMLAIQLDDRALFLERWQRLLLETLSPDACRDHPLRQQFRDFVERWGGRAAIDSVGYRLVREFRLDTSDAVLEPLVEACLKADSDYRLTRRLSSEDSSEGPVWRLVSEKPPHLLHPKYKSWDEQLLAVIDAIIDQATAGGRSLGDYSWGAYNTARIQHPLSRAQPLLSRWLDMPAEPLPGSSSDMPRIQRPDFGASERMAVSPGRESEGYFHMPGGQSGHPLSPNYRDGHEAWVRGKKTPFLPGPTVSTLTLVPARPAASTALAGSQEDTK